MHFPTRTSYPKSITATGLSGDCKLVLLPRGHDDKVQEGINSRSKGCLSTVPPGQGYTSLPYPGAGMFRHFGIEIGFKDAAGRSWVRKANGDLLEIKIPPIEYYRINLPVSWAVPEKEIAEDSYPDTEQEFHKNNVTPRLIAAQIKIIEYM